MSQGSDLPSQLSWTVCPKDLFEKSNGALQAHFHVLSKGRRGLHYCGHKLFSCESLGIGQMYLCNEVLFRVEWRVLLNSNEV